MRAFLLTLIVVFSIPAATWAQVSIRSEGSSSTSARIATLKEQLESGLRARRPEEFAFINRVVTQVDNGQLPRSLVKGTFQWARRKKPYPYPFFERALKIRAARLGIAVR